MLEKIVLSLKLSSALDFQAVDSLEKMETYRQFLAEPNCGMWLKRANQSTFGLLQNVDLGVDGTVWTNRRVLLCLIWFNRNNMINFLMFNFVLDFASIRLTGIVISILNSPEVQVYCNLRFCIRYFNMFSWLELTCVDLDLKFLRPTVSFERAVWFLPLLSRTVHRTIFTSELKEASIIREWVRRWLTFVRPTAKGLQGPWPNTFASWIIPCACHRMPMLMI